MSDETPRERLLDEIERLNGEVVDLLSARDADADVIEARGAEIIRLTAQLAEAREALRKLANEVGGLRAFEHEVRQAVSNTNWNVLMLRLQEAGAALTPPAQPGAETSGIAAIAAERRRQVEAEGWTSEHDDQHEYGEMAAAAACYALSSDPDHLELWWPWISKWWKPTNRRRDLVKAGALIAAEIDRLDRAARPGAETMETPDA